MTLFTDKAPVIMGRLMHDFALEVVDAAAILGNIGHESGGFRFMQEIHPVGGGRGGLGWCQWTGPRRVAFERYCSAHRLNTSADNANYAFLWLELTGSESGAVRALKRAIGLQAKVEAFEASFERAGVKNYPSRMQYAEAARRAYATANPSGSPPVAPVTIPVLPEPPPIPTQPESFWSRFVAWMVSVGWITS